MIARGERCTAGDGDGGRRAISMRRLRAREDMYMWVAVGARKDIDVPSAHYAEEPC